MAAPQISFLRYITFDPFGWKVELQCIEDTDP